MTISYELYQRVITHLLPYFKIWKHLKRKSTYIEFARGELQMATRPVKEGDVLIGYMSIDDGKIYYRLQEEFEDGRFEQLPEE